VYKALNGGQLEVRIRKRWEEERGRKGDVWRGKLRVLPRFELGS
jgi:hypothetical protein